MSHFNHQKYNRLIDDINKNISFGRSLSYVERATDDQTAYEFSSLEMHGYGSRSYLLRK